MASGAKTARPALDELLGQLRAGDVLVIWKLDRMGRSLKHLVELVGSLMERKVGLLSLNDPIDTTSVQRRLVFNLFASLAEFERELIRERKLSVAAIAQKLHVSKSTLYSYLRHRGVEIGPYKKSARAQPRSSAGAGEADPPKVATIRLTLRIENNSKFVRGKKRAREDIERYCLSEYDGQRLPSGEYELKVPMARQSVWEYRDNQDGELSVATK